MIPLLTEAEPRLQRRYHRLVVAHARLASPLAAGLHALPAVAQPFSAVQAAWRFYANDRVTLPQLIAPLRTCARQKLAAQAPGAWQLVVHDSSWLHYQDHGGKRGKVVLGHQQDQGYELLSSLLLESQSGAPLALIAQGLREESGWQSTGAATVVPVQSSLDDLTRQIAEVEALNFGPSLVHLHDREADSVDHYRRWNKAGYRFLVRADDQPQVRWQGRIQSLATVGRKLVKSGGVQKQDTPVTYHDQEAWRYVGETSVTLERPGYRRMGGKRRELPGVPLTLRLIVSEIRDAQGRKLARWLLLTNLPASVAAATVALWYYWRWRIESYFKLLKQAGQQVESWQQETAGALARRLLIAAAALVVAWQLAEAPEPQAAELRQVLVHLSGRQMKRGPKARGFTVPALLAGLEILLPMLALLEDHDLADLQNLVRHAGFWPTPVPRDAG